MSKIIPLLTLSLSLSFCGRVKKSEENSNKKLMTSSDGRQSAVESITIVKEKADEMIAAMGQFGITMVKTMSHGYLACSFKQDFDFNIILTPGNYNGEVHKLDSEQSQKLVEILANVGVPRQFEGIPNEIRSINCVAGGMSFDKEEHRCKIEYVKYLD